MVKLQTAEQLALFGNSSKTYFNSFVFRFCIKKHYALKAGLHYDLRFEVQRISNNKKSGSYVYSFAIPISDESAPFLRCEAVFVDMDHEVNSFRREGYILKLKGHGWVIHFDEGFFSIPGVLNLQDLIRSFTKGFENGSIMLFFDGYKIKGLFHLHRPNKNLINNWVLEKVSDEYDKVNIELFNPNSILPDPRGIESFQKEFPALKAESEQFKGEGKAGFIRQIESRGFIYNNLILAPRPHKIWLNDFNLK